MIILDNFKLNNILSIESYSSGEQFVRNMIILDRSKSKLGDFTFYVGPYGTHFSLYITVPSGATYYFLNHTTMQSVVNVLHTNADIRNAGIDAEIIDETLEGTYYPKAVRIFTTDETVDYRKVSVMINEGIGYSFKGSGVYEQTGGNYNLTLFTLLPSMSNATMIATDATSRLKYGSKLLVVPNYEILTSKKSIIETLNNKLQQLKDPKARMIVHVPFGSIQQDLTKAVEVRLARQNISQTSTFVEGSVYLSWELHSSGYRYKKFIITGKRDLASGTATSLTLMEKTY